MQAELSVVVPSLNGAHGVDRCLRALAVQTIRPVMEIIVVDDGSSDDTSAVARGHRVTVIRHPRNRGIAAARNTGLSAATADIVAFLDDDCEPEPEWAQQLLAGYSGQDVAGVGGTVVPATPPSYLAGFLTRNNPLSPIELNVAESNSIPYRFCLYLRRQWSSQRITGRRDVFSFVGANMSFRRKTLFDAGRFDERFRFGAEEVDVCLRVARDIPLGRLVFVPECRVIHHFRPELRDTLRRSRSYGRGSARLYRKWPSLPPTVFPGPLLAAMLLAASPLVPALAAVAVVLPLVLYPRGIRAAVRDRKRAALVDGYVQLAQETCEDIGFAQGLWQFRRLTPELPDGPADNREEEQPLWR